MSAADDDNVMHKKAVINQLAKAAQEASQLEDAYSSKAQQLADWIDAEIQRIAAIAPENSRESVEAALAGLREFAAGPKAERAALKVALKTELDTIQMRRANAGRKPFAPAGDLTVAALQKRWDRLGQAEAERLRALEAEAQRHLKIQALLVTFERKHAKLLALYEQKQAYLKTDPAAAAADEQKQDDAISWRLREKLHQEFEGELAASELRVKEEKALGERLVKQLNYHDGQRIGQMVADLEAKWEQLKQAGAAKKATLQKNVVQAADKNSTTREYLQQAKAVRLWLQTSALDIQASGFGRSLAAVREWEERIEKQDKELLAQAETMVGEVTKAEAELVQKKGVPPAEVAKDRELVQQSLAGLKATLERRRASWQAELAEQEKFEALRVQYVELAEAVLRRVEDTRKGAAGITAEDAAKALAELAALYQDGKPVQETIEKCAALEADASRFGISLVDGGDAGGAPSGGSPRSPQQHGAAARGRRNRAASRASHPHLQLGKLQRASKELEIWVNGLRQQLEEELELKTEYAEKSRALRGWLQAETANLRNFEAIERENSLASIQQETARFRDWRITAKAERSVLRDHLEALQRKIGEQGGQGKHPRPAYAPEIAFAQLAQAWKELEQAEEARGARLAQELARQEQLALLVSKFEVEAQQSKSFCEKSSAATRALNDPPADSLEGVQAAQSSLESLRQDVDSQSARLDELRQLLNAEILAKNPNNLEQLKALFAECETQFAACGPLLEERREQLAQAQAREERKEQAGQRLALELTEFHQWLAQKTLSVKANSVEFGGNSLSAVRAYQVPLDMETKASTKQVGKRQEKLSAALQQCQELGVAVERYSKLRSEEIQAQAAALLKLLDDRQQAYAAELARQERMAERREQYTQALAAFGQQLQDTMDKVRALEGEPEAVLAALAPVWQEGEPLAQSLAALQQLHAECLAMGIEDLEAEEAADEANNLSGLSLKLRVETDWVRTMQARLQEEQQLKQQYEAEARRLADWIQANLVSVEDLSALDNTEATARRLVQQFQLWQETEKAKHAALKARVESFADKIASLVQNGAYNRPAHAPTAGLSVEDLGQLWERLLEKERKRDERQSAELARQEQLSSAHARFLLDAESFEKHLAGLEEFFAREENVEALGEAHAVVTRLEATMDQLEVSENKKGLLEEVVRLMVQHGGHREQAEVDARLAALQGRYDQIRERAQAKDGRLRGLLEAEQNKERARAEYARVAGAYVSWQKAKMQSVETASFGSNLAAVREAKEQLVRDDQAVLEEDQYKREQVREAAEALRRLQVPEGDPQLLRYTEVDSARVAELAQQLQQALGRRMADCEAQLRQQTELEEQRMLFAQQADQFVELCERLQSELGVLEGEPPAVLEGIAGRYQEGAAVQAALAELRELERHLREDLGSQQNPHTRLNAARCAQKAEVLDAWVQAFVRALQDELRQKEEYRARTAELMQWLEAAGARLTDPAVIRDKHQNTLESVRQAVAELQRWGLTEKAQRDAFREETLALMEAIENLTRTSKHSRPVFVPEIGADQIQLAWNGMLEQERQRQELLSAEFLRQEEIAAVRGQFEAQSREFADWLTQMEAYLTQEEDVRDLGSCQVCISRLDATVVEIRGWRGKHDSLRDLCERLRELEYPEQDAVAGRTQELVARYEALPALQEAKQAALDGLQQREQAKEDARLRWSTVAAAFESWVKAKTLTVTTSGFGNTLESVTEYLQTIEAEEAQAEQERAELLADCERAEAKLGVLEVADRKYTQHTTASLQQLGGLLTERMKERREAYAAELARQQAMETKRLEFASLADHFMDLVEAQRAEMEQKVGPPLQVIEAIHAVYQGGRPVQQALEAVMRCDAECKDLTIVTNKHTPYSLSACQRQAQMLAHYVSRFEQELREEEERRTEYDVGARATLDWVQENLAVLRDFSLLEDNTLEAVQHLLGQFDDWRDHVKAPRAAELKMIHVRANKLAGSLARSKHTRPPFEPEHPLQELDDRWKELVEAEHIRDERLRSELERQEKLAVLFQNKFTPLADELEAWLAAKEEYLRREEVIQSLNEAEAQITALDSCNAEIAHHRTQRDELESTAAQITELRHKEQAAIEERSAAIVGRFEALGGLAAAKNELLQAALAREQAKENARRHWAKLVRDYTSWQTSTVRVLSLKQNFGASLAAVEAARSSLDDEDEAFQAEERRRTQELEAADEELRRLGVEDRKYAAETLADLAEFRSELLAYVEKRRRDYKEELVRQKDMEDKRLEFAQCSAEMMQRCDAIQRELSELEGESVEVLEGIERIYGHGEGVEAMLERVRQVDQESQALGILRNPHTTNTVDKCSQRSRLLATWVDALTAQLKSELANKEEFDRRALALLNWIEESRVWLADRSGLLVNTLEAVHALLAELKTWKRTAKAQHAALRRSTLALGAEIVKTLRSSEKIRRPEFSPPHAPELLNEQWKLLVEAEADRDQALNAELARQVQLTALFRQFRAVAEELEHNIGLKEEYLRHREAVDSLDSARRHLHALAASDEEMRAWKPQRDELETLSGQIVELRHKDREELAARQADLTGRYDALEELSAQKADYLQRGLRLEEQREQARLEWSRLVEEYEAWQQSTVLQLEKHEFGNTLAAVAEYGPKLAEETTALEAAHDDRLGRLEAAESTLAELGVEDRKYSAVTLEGVRRLAASLRATVAERQAAYDEELARQQAVEAKKQEFKQVAEAFIQHCEEAEAAMSALDFEPDQTISSLAKIYEDGLPTRERLALVERVWTEALALGITHPEHTQVTVETCVQREQFLHQYHRSFLKDLQEEKRDKHEYEVGADELLDWIETQQEELEDFSALFENTLEAVRAEFEKFQLWRNRDKAQRSATKSKLEGLCAQVVTKLKTSRHARPEFNPGQELTIEAIQAGWERLLVAETRRESMLAAELRRQETLYDKYLEFQRRSDEMEAWLRAKEAFLADEPVIHDVQTAQVQLAAVDAGNADREAFEPKRAELEQLVASMEAMNGGHKEQPAIAERLAAILARFGALEGLSAAKRANLERQLAHQEECEQARHTWQRLVADYVRWQEEHLLLVHTKGFGETLAAVVEFKAGLDAQDAELTATNAAKVEALVAADQHLERLGVPPEDRKYTNTTIAEIHDLSEALHARLQARLLAYAAELLRQQDMEARRREFARLCQEFVELVEDLHQRMDALEGPAETVLADVREIYAGGRPVEIALELVEQADARCHEAGITSNEYTELTVGKCSQRSQSLQYWVKNYTKELEAEIRDIAAYTAKSAALLEWAGENRVLLEDIESAVESNTLAGIRAAIAQFEQWRETDKADHAALLQASLDLHAAVSQAVAQSEHRRPAFAPEITVEALQAAWEALVAAEQARAEAFKAELSRQEKLFDLYARFQSQAEALQTWIAGQERFLKTPARVHDVSSATVQRAMVRSKYQEIQAEEPKRTALELLGVQLRSLRHKELERIEAVLADLLARFDRLLPANELKQREADALLKSQEIKENYKGDWEAKSTEYADWQLQQLLRIALSGFGHNLREVESYQEAMAAEDSQLDAEDTQKVEELRQLSTSLEQSRVKAAIGVPGMVPVAAPIAVPESDDEDALGLLDDEAGDIFDRRLPAELSFAIVDRLSKQLRARMQARRVAYTAELAKQRAMEAKRLEFAAAADRFRQACLRIQELMQASRGPPEAVLEQVRAEWLEGAPIEALLAEVARLHAESLQQGIHSNEHTELSLADCRQMEKVGRRAVEAFLAQLGTEISRKAEYDQKAAALVAWIAENRVLLEDRSPLEENTLAAARAEIRRLKEWRLERKAPQQNLLTELLNLAGKIKAELANSKYERPAFEPEHSTDSLKERWQELLEAEQLLDEALRRELDRQEKMTALYANKFLPPAEELEAWLAAKEEYLRREEVIQSLNEAEAQITALEASAAEIVHHQAIRDELGATVRQIAELRHKEQAAIDARTAGIMERFEGLGGLSEEKDQRLQAALAREQEKETARLEWARLASDYIAWQKSAVLGLTGSSGQFGDTLKAVQESKERLDAEDAGYKAQDDSRLQALAEAEAQLLRLEVDDRKYSTETLASIQELSNELNANIAARQEAYAGELRRQQVMEAKRQEFAVAAKNFMARAEELEKQLEELEGEPQVVLAGLAQVYQHGKPLQELLAGLEAIDAQAQQLGITENEHTFLSVAKCALKVQKLDSWVQQYEAELVQEQQQKDEYNARAEQLVQWIEHNVVVLRDISDVLAANSLEFARQAGTQLKVWRQNDKAAHAALKAEIIALGSKVEQEMKSSPHHRPDFEPPITTQDLNDEWEELLSAERQRDEKLALELSRQVKLAALLEEFITGATVFEQWLAQKEDYLEREEVVDSLDAASVLLQALDVTVAEIQQSQAKKEQLQKLASDLRGLGHREQEDIDARLELMVQRYDALEGRGVQKGQMLRDALALEQAKEQCRQEWAKLADDYIAWQQERVISVSDADFGNTLAEVRSFLASMNEEDAAITSVDQSKLAAMEAAWEELVRLGVQDLKYTNHSWNDLRHMSDELGAALYARQDQYVRALERHEAMEAKRLQYKDAAEDFMRICDETEANVDSLEGEPDVVIAGIAQAYQDGEPLKQALMRVRVLDEEAIALEVRDNEHTNITVEKCVERTVAVQQCFHDYVWELQEEKRDKHEYEELSERLVDWIEESTERLADLACLEANTIEAVREAIKQFQVWRVDEKAEHAALKFAVEALGEKIVQQLRASRHRRPDFNPGPGLRPAEIDQLWNKLIDVEKTRDSKLTAELERQEKLVALRAQFETTAAELEAWLAGKEVYLSPSAEEADLRGVSAVQVHLAALETSNNEVNAWQPKLDSMVRAVDEMNSLRGCREQAAVDARASQLQQRFGDLGELAAKKLARLQASRAMEEDRDKARREWARQAEEFRAWVQETILATDAEGPFGDTLSAVEAYRYEMQREEDRVEEAERRMLEAARSVAEELERLGVAQDDIPYTALRMPDLEADGERLQAKLASRREAWQRELERQQAMEAKRREYAAAVDEFEATVEGLQQQLGGLGGEPGAVLEKLAAAYGEGAAVRAALEKVSALQRESAALHIAENEYASASEADCQRKAKELEEWVRAYQAELAEEQRDKEQYEARSQDLLAWIKGTAAALADTGMLRNNLESVQAALDEFGQWRSADKAERQAEMAEVLALAEKIEQGLRDSSHQRPGFAPAIGVNELEKQWEGLLAAERRRHETLSAELARQERLVALARQFDQLAEQLEPWIAAKEEYFELPEAIADLGTAQVLSVTLESVMAEMGHFKEKRNALENCATEMRGEGGHAEQAAIDERLAGLLGRFDSLASQRDSKQFNLHRALTAEQQKEKARLKYAALAQDYQAWHASKMLGLKLNDFGSSLAAVKRYRQVLSEEDRQIQSEDRQRLDALRKAEQQLQKLNVVDRGQAAGPSVAEAQNLSAELAQRLQDRRQAYAAELSRQEDMEARRKEFASASAGFIELITRMEERFLNATGKAANIQALLQNEYQDGLPIRTQLAEVERLDGLCKELRIMSNEHTQLTLDRCAHRAAVFDNLVRQLTQEIEAELAAIEHYESQAADLSQWIAGQQKQLADLAGVDADLASVRAAVAELREYRLGEKTRRSTQQAALEAQDQKIRKLLESSRLKRQPYAPRVGVADLQRQWDALQAQEDKRETQLRTLLAKHERLAQLVVTFGGEVAALEAYVARVRPVYEDGRPAESLEQAQLAVCTLAALADEHTAFKQRREQLKQLANDIRRAGPPADMREIEKQLRAASEAFDSLSSLKEKKGSRAKEDLARHRAREEAARKFASLAADYIRWARDTQEAVAQAAAAGFGSTLEEVKAAGDALRNEDSQVRKTNQKLAQQAEQAYRAAADLAGSGSGGSAAVGNVTAEDVGVVKQEVEAALAKRQSAFQAQLQHCQQVEAKQREYADLVESFLQTLRDVQGRVAEAQRSKDSESARIALIQRIYQEGAVVQAPFDRVAELAASCKAMGAAVESSNPYTTMTLAALAVKLDQFKAFVNSQLAAAEDELQSAAHEGSMGALEQQKEQEVALRLKYVGLANKLSVWMAEVHDSNSADLEALRGSVAEVAEQRQVWQRYAGQMSNSQQTMAQIKGVLLEMEKAGVREYGDYEPVRLEADFQATVEFMANREAALNQAKSVQEQGTRLRRQYAQAAANLVEWMDAHQAALAKLACGGGAGGRQAANHQLQALAKLRHEYQKSGTKRFAALEAAQRDLTDAGAVPMDAAAPGAGDRASADMGFGALASEFEALAAALDAKEKVLKAELAQGQQDLPPQQVAELQQLFKRFDKNSNNSLSPREFKSALEAVGHRKSNDEVDAIVKQIGVAGNGMQVQLDEFVAYVAGLQANGAHASDDVVAAFQAVAGGDSDVITKEQLLEAVDPAAANYLMSVMTPVAGGYDYKSWVAKFL